MKTDLVEHAPEIDQASNFAVAASESWNTRHGRRGEVKLTAHDAVFREGCTEKEKAAGGTGGFDIVNV
jgi:hypothetical protein